MSSIKLAAMTRRIRPGDIWRLIRGPDPINWSHASVNRVASPGRIGQGRRTGASIGCADGRENLLVRRPPLPINGRVNSRHHTGRPSGKAEDNQPEEYFSANYPGPTPVGVGENYRFPRPVSTSFVSVRPSSSRPSTE